MTLDTSTTRIPAPDEYRWLPKLGRLLVGQTIDPADTPEPLRAGLIELNARSSRARDLRSAYGSMTEAAFRAAITYDREADVRAASTGTWNGKPSNTAGTFLDERLRLHRDADTWTAAANSAGYDVLRIIADQSDTIALAAAPDLAPSLVAVAKAARTALEKTRPTMAAMDYCDAFSDWVRNLDSLDALNTRRKPASDAPGRRQADLDAALAVLDTLIA
jgi:hypothetical protein